MSHSVNRATAVAFEKGWITSASIMVPCPWFPEVVEFAAAHPQADLGIHLTLNSEWPRLRWGPVAPRDVVSSLIDAEGYFPYAETEVVEKSRVSEIELELRAQIDRARKAGIAVTHFDSHMLTLFGSPELFAAYVALSDEYAMPVRVGTTPMFDHPALAPLCTLLDGACEAGFDLPPDRWLDGYKEMLAALPPGAHQLTVHLGFDDDEMRGATREHPAWGAAWRQRDFDLVSSEHFRRFLRDENFTLVTWRDLAAQRSNA